MTSGRSSYLVAYTNGSENGKIQTQHATGMAPLAQKSTDVFPTQISNNGSFTALVKTSFKSRKIETVRGYGPLSMPSELNPLIG